MTTGDTAIYPDYAVSGDIRSAGDEPVTVIGMAIVASDGAGTPVTAMLPNVQATALTQTSGPDWAALPAGPLNVALRQVTLPPGPPLARTSPSDFRQC